MMKANHEEMSGHLTMIKKFGLFGFLFFFAKGMLWVLVPTLLAYLNMN